MSEPEHRPPATLEGWLVAVLASPRPASVLLVVEGGARIALDPDAALVLSEQIAAAATSLKRNYGES